MSLKTYKPSAKGFTPEQIADLKPKFDKVDTDNNGKLDLDETKVFFKSFGLEEYYAPIAFEICDTDNDGSISFDEFAPFFKLLNDLHEDDSCIYRNLFDKFDTDKNGYLDRDETRKFFKFFTNENYNNADFNLVFKYNDTDHDGKLSFDEVCAILSDK